jgi:hypothetical protein
MSQSKTPKAPTQAPRDEKPPGKEEPLFAYRIEPDGEPQRFYNRDPDYRWTMQSPDEAQVQRRPQQSKLVQQQQQQVQSGSYTDLEPSPRTFQRSRPMPGYQGVAGSYGSVKAAVVPSNRMQAQSGSYVASDYGSASRATDGAPWSGSPYEAVASQQATAEAECLAMCGCEYSSHQPGASGIYSSASGSIRQRKAMLQQAQQQPGSYKDFDSGDDPGVDRRTQTTHQQQSRSGSYQDFDFRDGPHVDCETQTMPQPHSQSGSHRRPDRDSLWNMNGSAASLYETIPRKDAQPTYKMQWKNKLTRCQESELAQRHNLLGCEKYIN